MNGATYVARSLRASREVPTNSHPLFVGKA